jgi:phosphate acetyltransferase
MEEVVALARPVAKDVDVVVVEGLVPDEALIYSVRVNRLMAEALDADVLLVGAPHSGAAQELVDDFEIVARGYAEKGVRIEGCIVNKVGPREPTSPRLERVSLVGALVHEAPAPDALDNLRSALEAADLDLRVVGLIPLDPIVGAPRVLDVARALGARVIREGQLADRRVTSIRIGAMTPKNLARYIEPGALIVTPGDRDDVVMACALASLSGTPLAGVLLTGGIEPSETILDLCRRAFETGLPLLLVDDHTGATNNRLAAIEWEIPTDDVDRATAMLGTVADHLDPAWLSGLRSQTREPRMSPPAFRHMLIEEARAEPQRIVLPEGDEPRTIAAAAVCQARGIAQCVLLGEPSRIFHVAADQGVKLPKDIEIIRPSEHRERYVAPMVEMRGHKGLTPDGAQKELEDNVVLGTMMLALDEVHGLVSGAVHTTANTVRPAFQLIKTAPGVKLVSSVFFMCLPDQVLVYGDCAINPDPNAEELADIAVQSADSASSFGIPARVAMISYSTGDSGEGADIDKVRAATQIAKARRPDLLLDGPLQYDAAINPEVGQQKAPNSPVAGKATVLVFPDLNTGNTTYKAVQRSARVVSIGPMLQGLNKPVNDLSRGALVEDIIYTIALTAIQARRRKAESRP